MSSLTEIHIELDGIGHILADRNLSVPIYQRSYAWKDTHVKDLLDDLGAAIAEDNPEYFLGSIIVTGKNKDLVEVVDGQQRLATVTILLAAIRDYLFEIDEKDRANQLEQKYLTTVHIRTQERVPRLRLNETDRDFFAKGILAAPNHPDRSVVPNKDSHRLIAQAAKLAANHIKHAVAVGGQPIDRLLDWVDYLDEKVKIIWVQVPDEANAFIIFETLNDRGLTLAISDLLKNYFFGQAQDRLPEVQNRWISMLSVLDAVGSEALVLPYIRHYWSSKHGVTREKELYDQVKKKVTSKQKAVDMVEELTSSVDYYAAIHLPEHEIWNKYGTTTRNHMNTLNQLGQTQIRPLILAVLSAFSVLEVQKSLKLMVSWAARFLISGTGGSGVLEHQYAQRAVEVRNGTIKTARDLAAAMQGVVPSDNAFKAVFANATVSKDVLARYYLRVLELQAQGLPEPAFVPNSNEDVVNLEHILPEHPSNGWSYIDAETLKIYYKRIGNLALLGKKINSSIGNKGFQEKKKAYAASPFTLTQELTKYTVWGTAEIELRQQQLAELAVKAWSIRI